MQTTIGLLRWDDWVRGHIVLINSQCPMTHLCNRGCDCSGLIEDWGVLFSEQVMERSLVMFLSGG